MVLPCIGSHDQTTTRPSRFTARMRPGRENVDQLQQLVGLQRRTALQPDRVLDAAEIFDVAVIELAGAIADPDHVAGGRVPVAGRGIDAGERLLVAEQQRLMAGVEIGRAQLGMAFQIKPAGAHEVQRVRDAVGQFLVTPRLRGIFQETQHPLMHRAEIGEAAGRERAQQVERRRRLAIGHQLALRIGRARLFREGDVVDDVAAIARQFDAVDLLGRRGARLGELAGDAADLHHRHRAGIGQHHSHLQQHPEEIADVVGAVLGETLGAIAALQKESLAGGDAAERLFQVSRLTCKNQRRKRRELRLDIRQCLRIGILGHLQHRPAAPAIGCPCFGHDVNSLRRNRYLSVNCGRPLYTQANRQPPVCWKVCSIRYGLKAITVT
jgi:hypothetical protein